MTIANTGRGNLNVKNIQIVGDDAQEFQMIDAPKASLKKLLKIAKNSAVTFNVAFKPSSKGHKKAQLVVKSHKKNKKDQEVTVELKGLGMVYEESTEVAADSAAAARKGTDATQLGVEVRGITVYPNPNAPGSKVYVKLQHFGKGEPVTLSLLDAKGQLVQARTVVTNQQGAADAELPLAPSLSRGMYIIQAQGQSANKRTKLIVE
ncbi:MAG: T9SS type A sorting domain-containing protein [Cytophagales bacterium]|nr:T9SS type A sorting domain-containing protein [Cytophagales bacterium]